METVPETSEIQIPKTSPEPSSTRPNPFDDSDVSSRKRRRTSASGSPSASVETGLHRSESGSSPFSTVNTSVAALDDKMKVDRGSQQPRTPPQAANSPAFSPEPPTSSRVTINLRNAPYSDSTASPSAPQYFSPSKVRIQTPEEDQVQKSIEEEADLGLALNGNGHLGLAHASPVASPSPPVEVITIQEDDGVAEEVELVFDQSLLDGPMADPTMEFPYSNTQNTLLETSTRLQTYFSSQPNPDPASIQQIREWLDKFLTFAKQSNPQVVLESLRSNKSFWLYLPNIIDATINRQYVSTTRVAVLGLYHSFLAFTAHLLLLDSQSIQEWQSHLQPDPDGPQLFAPDYLHQLFRLKQYHEQLRGGDFSDFPLNTPGYMNVGSYFIRQLQSFLGGSIEFLGSFATALAAVVSVVPKLVDALAPVAQVLVYCLHEPADAIGLASQEQLKDVYDLWESLSSLLGVIIDKHVGHLTKDRAAMLIEALSEMLRICLPCGHDNTNRLIEDHKAEYPDLVASSDENLSTSLTVYAIMWEWKTDMLARLIRSTQMQLRVMAIEIMSTELIASWRRTSNHEVDPQDPFLSHQGRYLLRINLVDYLTGSNCHPELVAGSSNILGFLVVTKMYSATHSDRLWQGISESQDPRAAKALTELNSSIANLLDYNELSSLCEKFQTLPIQDFNPSTINFCSYMLKELVARCQRDGRAPGLLPYELCLRLLRESSICTSDSQSLYPEIQSEAMARLDNLVALGMDDQDRKKLYSFCAEDLAANSPTAMGSLCCLQIAMKGNVASELTVLIEQFGFATLLVEELAHAINVGRAAGMPVVFSGASNRPRREFIAKVIYHRPDAVSGDLGEKLWNLLVGTACLGDEDRNSGWEVIMAFDRETAAGNPFLQSCYSLYLPSLPPSCFCRGMLNCLWRIILGADDAESVSIGIKALAVDVYLESRAILTYPFNRARQIHSSFVDRCLGQLKDAARKIKASSDGISSGEDEPMIIVTSEDEIHQQERIFARTLQLLGLFVETHYTKPALCAPDFRPFVNQDPNEVQGDLTMLQYQSFDNGTQTEMKPLHIGKLNTAASLLSSLKLETGFSHYRVFYQGQQFLPTEEEICKSLESLEVNEGLILVRREEDDFDAVNAVRVKPGSSPIEIQILSRFQELWMYLGMEDAIAKEVYSLLVQLPTDGGIIDLFESPTVAHTDIFPPGQPYKSLYVIRALTEYIESIRLIESSDETGRKALRFSQSSYEEALKKSYSLVVLAISNESFLEQITPALQIELMQALMATFVRLLQNTWLLSRQSVKDGATYPSPRRLVEILSYASESTQVGSESLIDGSISAILRLCLIHDDFLEEIANLDSFTDLVKSLILLNPRSTVRNRVVEMIREAVEIEEGLIAPSESDAIAPFYPLTKFAWSTISSFLSEAISVPSQCHEFFGGLEYLLYKTFQIMPSEVDTPAVAAQVCQLLLSHDSTESLDQPESQDVLANDLLSILLGCLQVDETLPASSSLPDDIVQDLFWRHLFPKLRSQLGQPVQNVLLRPDTRQKLYKAILRLAENNQVVLGPLLRSLNSLVPYYSDESEGHYIYDLPCQFNREKAIKPCSYVGLRNLSNTCYLNALVTQLFMNTQFRQFILSLDIPYNSSSQQLLFHVQKLLAYMQESHCRFVDPEHFVLNIRTYEDTYIDINSQMDVDEFYNLLFDRLEAQLPRDDQKRELRGIYGGQLVQQIKSQECTHVSERFEPFSAIQCDINGKRTLRESLEAYVGGEIMEGDNRYKCSSCDRHVDAVKRACLKDVPDNLIFHLKRFDFSLRTFQRSKINDYFSFPRTIDMRPYTIDHLRDPAADVGQEDIFELVGILVHSGTAESGHYYSFIRERTSTDDQPRWFEFNDDNVSLWDSRNMANQTFGGPGQQSVHDTNGTGYAKNYSGYMLFYQRSSSLAAEQEQAGLSTTTGAVTTPVQVEVPPNLKEHILRENANILKRHCLFDPNYTIFVEACFVQAKLFGNNSSLSPWQQQYQDGLHDLPHGLKDLAMEMALSHLDQLVTRIENTPDLEQFSEMIRLAVVECVDCALAFFEYFSRRHEAFRMLAQRHPDAAVRNFSCKMLIIAMEKIATEMPNVYDPLSANIVIQDDRSDIAVDSPASRSPSSPRPSVLDEAMFLIDHLWRHFHLHLRSWDEVFGLLLEFAKMGPREVAQLLAHDYLLKLLRIIAADTMTELSLNYSKMLQNIYRRLPRPPPYAAILELIDYLIWQLEPLLGTQYIVDTAEERLNRDEAPFPWTADEVQMIHSHPERQLGSFFVEKLIAIDQARPTTHRILGRLTSLAPQMDMRIFHSLRRKLEADSTMQPMDPFLRAAVQYLESTQSIPHSRNIVRFIALQARSLQNTEPVAFLEFFSAALNLKRPDSDIVRAIQSCSLETLPDWVPHLLACGDGGVRYDTVRLLDVELFDQMSNTDDVDEDDVSMLLERRDKLKEIVQKVGRACVFYLRDTHVRQRNQIGRDTALVMVQVTSKCTPYFSDEPGVDDERSIEFNNLQIDTANAVRAMIVDEVEDDNSDWEGSYMSSDPLDCQPDLGVEQIGEPDGALATR
ncbi:hypothetical protein TRIATDRAFT_40314 [Trichoderma atroviride IMI 206040]|uniref:USP domain-containing protein n=1 Tax=Hypocrea atroviridis (strain ATCC 20476 / IMI 206040) TaxID=452589 RepID=G9NUD3_HYPAI|nr:uncharacterized protein TRIATDRAFT_40314 [Trichoderma atroviride IMI 206040]EHK45664.1 hypothetical protein TRIATDRAFT_40314 [Trichoderma atroviride IMI 206040]